MLATTVGCSRPPAAGVGERFLDALNAHDPSQVTALMTADATFREPGRPPLDPTALREHLARQWEAWADQLYSPRAILTLPEATVIEWEVHQTHRNRDPVTLTGVFVLDVHQDRITAVRNYYDATPLLRFLKHTPS